MPPAIASSSPRATRIRENQRRSRQRKREYVNLLESRLSRCRSEGVSASHELKQAALRIKRENETLRGLLRSVGVAEDVIESATLEPGEYGGSGGHIIDVEQFSKESASPSGGCEALASPRSEASGGCCGSDDPTATSASITYPSQRGATGCPPFNVTTPLPSTEKANVCSSISCEDAHRLIKRLLLRKGGEAACGRAMSEITMKLYPGFQEADVDGKPCRIKDEVLCEVLEMLNSKETELTEGNVNVGSHGSSALSTIFPQRGSPDDSSLLPFVGEDLYSATTVAGDVTSSMDAYATFSVASPDLMDALEVGIGTTPLPMDFSGMDGYSYDPNRQPF